MTKYIKYLRSNFDVSMGGDMVEKLVVEGIEKHVAMEEEENRYLLSRLGGEGHEPRALELLVWWIHALSCGVVRI